MIGTGPAENRLDDAEAVNAIPLSHPEIVVAVSLPSNRYCMRSEFPVGLTIEMLERAFAVYVGRKHNVAVPDARLGSSWQEKALGIGREEVIASSYSFLRPCMPSIWRTHGGSLPTPNVGPKRASRQCRRTQRPSTPAIIAANPNGHPAPMQVRSSSRCARSTPKGGEAEHATIEEPTGL